MNKKQIFDPEVNVWMRELIWTYCSNVSKPVDGTDDILFRCPFCGDSKKSKKMRGHYYKKTGSFYCFNGGCNRAASWERLASKLTGMSIEQVETTMTARRLNSGMSQESEQYLKALEDAENKSNDFVKRAMGIDPLPIDCELPQSIVHWTQNIIAKNLIESRLADLGQFKPDGFDYWYWPEKRRVIIPWVDEKGNTIYWQARATQEAQDPKYLFPKDSKRPLSFMKQDENWPYYVIVEGVFNGIWVKNGVVCGSCKCTELQQKMVDIARNRGKKIIWLFDNDSNGSDDAAGRAIKKMVEGGKYASDLFFQWPDDLLCYKDINDVVVGLEKNPFSDPDFILKNCKSVPEMMLQLSK